jgi:hypothetical protein
MARRAGSRRVTCESCLPIDIRDWRRRGLLRVGLEFPVFWNLAGKLCGYMSVHIEHNAAVLFFHSQFLGDIERRQIEQRVPIVWTACFLGGQRPWFQCTVYSGNQYCGRRVAILYGAGDLFACRHCYGLAYASQKESPRFRNISRSRKIRMRLGGCADLGAPFPAKPRNMHWRTYDRLRTRGEAADRIACGQLRLPRRLQLRYYRRPAPSS